MQRRKSARAIIFAADKLVAMYREKTDRVYYTFPGGGQNENETEIACVEREVKEEFGLDVKAQKKVYVYTDEKTEQAFWLCEWVGGEFGEGQGEEFAADRNRGIYVPSLIEIDKLSNLPLMPPVVAKQLLQDIQQFGQQLDNQVKHLSENDQ